MDLGENLADAGGIVRALEAWKETKSDDRQNFKLPGLQSYTMEQLFFVSFGQIWCSMTKDTTMLKRVLIFTRTRHAYVLVAYGSTFTRAIQSQRGIGEFTRIPECIQVQGRVENEP